MLKRRQRRSTNTSKPERIQKLLARQGVASRRQVEQWIKEGRITVNRRLATLGQCVTARDKINLDGRALRLSPRTHSHAKALMYYKQEGEMCTQRDPEGRPTVFAKLPRLHRGRWVMVGRLDVNSSGLLLFTTNGELAHRLMHPRYQIEREYAVRVLGNVSPEMIKRLEQGVKLEDGPAKFDQITRQGGQGANVWYHVILREGRQREVRRLWESQGVRVSRLIRFRYGPISMPRDFHLGERRYLRQEDISTLLSAVNLEKDS